MKVRIAVTGQSTGAQKREHSAREQDGGDHRRTPTAPREAAASGRPAHQSEA